MQNSYEKLPEGYKEKLSQDLKNDKKLAAIVNITALVIMVVMIVPDAVF